MRFLRNFAAFGMAAALMAITESALAQAPARTIPYHPNAPIAERLVPGDTNVTVERTPLSSIVSPAISESFEEEVKRLSRFTAVVGVELSGVYGELTENGAWIRTRVVGPVTQVLNGAPQTASSSIEFWHDGGTILIGSVAVTAGAFTKFVVGEQYLVFLVYDKAREAMIVARTLRINSQGIVEDVERTDGHRLMARSKLIGRSISELVTAFSQVK